MAEGVGGTPFTWTSQVLVQSVTLGEVLNLNTESGTFPKKTRIQSTLMTDRLMMLFLLSLLPAHVVQNRNGTVS